MPTESRDLIYQAVRAAVLARPEAPPDLATYKMVVCPTGWDRYPVEAEGGGVPITRAPAATVTVPVFDQVHEFPLGSPHPAILPVYDGIADGIPYRVGWNQALRTVVVWIP